MKYNSLKNSLDSTGALIDDIIKCYICLGKIQDACMCPNCQKLTCQKCLQKWIMEKKSQCPHCRNPLRISQVIKIGFMNDVANYIDHITVKVKKETLEMCPIHSIQFLYYCLECKMPLCSDCFMLEETHKNHPIKKMKIIYETHRSNIRKEEDQLTIQCDRLNQYLKDINDKIIEIGNFKAKKSQELTDTFDLLKKKLENNAHDVLSRLMSKKNLISEKLNELDKGRKDIERKIVDSSQSDLIKRSKDIITVTKELINKNNIDESVLDNIQLNLSMEMSSDYYASYQSSSFYIDYFNSYAQLKEPQVIFSPAIRMNGILWRLKVYPRGNSGSNFEYLSVFLELIEGNSNNIEPSKYYYKIELVNCENSKRNFCQEHSSEFSQGDCWGYNKFFKLEKIQRDGFMNKVLDRITITFHVRPETFYQLSRDLMYYISQLEKKDSSRSCNSNNNKEIASESNRNQAVKSKLKLSLIKNSNKNNNDDCFNLLSDESIQANDRLSKSMRIETQSNIKIAKELFGDINNDNTNSNNNNNNNNGLKGINVNVNKNVIEIKEEDLKESTAKKKSNKFQKHQAGFGHQYMHTIDSDLNNKLSKVNISPIREKKSDQIANLQKFQIDLSLDSQNEDDFKDFNFLLSKQVKSDSFNEDSYGILMDSLKGKDDKDIAIKKEYEKYKSNKKEEKNFYDNNNPFRNNNYLDCNSKYNPFLFQSYKNSQFGPTNNKTSDFFKNLFEPKK